MAISTENELKLQEQYDKLRSQGMTKDEATANIKSTLKSGTTASGANVYDTLKAQYTVPKDTPTVTTGGGELTPFGDKATTPGGVILPTSFISDNNKVLNGATTTSTDGTTERVKSPLELAQEEIARKNAEIAKKNQEYETLQNKGATSELTAGVIPGMSGKGEQGDFYSGISSFLQTNLQNELANLEKQKADLQESIKGGQLTAEEQKATLQPYEQFLDKVTKLQDINKAQIAREQDDLKNRYNQTIDRQKKANELALINAQKIAAITGVGFTSGGIQGINNIIDEGNQAITSLEQERESMLSKYKDADSKLDIEYLDTITTIQNESKKALQDRYNSVITQIQKIDTEKGKATKEGLQAIKEVAKDYFDALDKQWERDYKIMDFNYKKLLDYKKDLREQEKIERDSQKDQLDFLTKGDLTSLTDEDILTIGQDMDLDNTTIKSLILQREKQKKENELEERKALLEERKFTEMTPSQRAQYELDQRKLQLEENKFRAEQGDMGTGTYTGDFQDLTGILKRPAGSKNVGQDTNNPGNIMADSQGQKDYAKSLGAIGFYSSPNGRTYAVFPDMNTGLQAMMGDLNTKLTGGSSWATPNTTLAKFASGWVSGPNAPLNQNAVNNYVKLTGYSANTPISQIPLDKLARAIISNEGVDVTKNANVPSVSLQGGQQKSGLEGYTPTQSELNKFTYSEKLTPNLQNEYLKKEKLLDKYLQYNQDRTTKGIGLLEGISNIQDISFPEKTTEFKTKSYNYGTRMDESNKIMLNAEKVFTDRTTFGQAFQTYSPNILKSSDQQKLEQAQRNFINAVLRQESGAVISDQEFDNASKQYFPKIGDSIDVLNQKRKNREMAIYNMLKSAGKDEQGRDIGNIWKELNKTKTPTTGPLAPKPINLTDSIRNRLKK